MDALGENQILLYPGANRTITQNHLDSLTTGPIAPEPGDWFLTQNETNLVKEALQWAQSLGLRTAYAAAPFNAEAIERALPYIDAILNAVEAQYKIASAARSTSLASILWPSRKVMVFPFGTRTTGPITLSSPSIKLRIPPAPVIAFLAASQTAQDNSQAAIRFAQAAAALSVTQTGVRRHKPTDP